MSSTTADLIVEISSVCSCAEMVAATGLLSPAGRCSGYCLARDTHLVESVMAGWFKPMNYSLFYWYDNSETDTFYANTPMDLVLQAVASLNLKTPYWIARMNAAQRTEEHFTISVFQSPHGTFGNRITCTKRGDSK